jgi:hypothetical protein
LILDGGEGAEEQAGDVGKSSGAAGVSGVHRGDNFAGAESSCDVGDYDRRSAIRPDSGVNPTMRIFGA